MSTEHIIIVGCGAAKRDTPTKARDLYTSTYFAKKRAYAETADQWRILSAEHGLVEPDTEIEPYETTIDDLDDQVLEGWADLVTTTLEELTVFELDGETDTIVLEVLAGQSYVEPIRSPLEIVDADNPSVDVRFPFDETSGIGDQMGWLSEQVDGEGRAVAADGGQPEDDVHWIRPGSLTKFDMATATLLDRLADADGTATLDDLCRGDFKTGAAASRIQTLFEHDVVDYELDQDDPDATEIELAHDTIRVMPIVVDGERPTLRDVLEESVGDVPEGVLEDV